MSGQPLDEFTTLMESQGPAWMRGPENMVNEGVLRNYTWARIQAGKSMLETVQGGDEIQDRIYFDVNSTFNRYNPNVRLTYDQSQPGVNWTVPWAFAYAYRSWTKQDLGLNKGVHSANYRSHKYKSVMYQKDQELWTDVCNSIDGEFWAVPDRGTMEDSSTTGGAARQPYSIPAFVNEYDDGLVTSGEGGAANDAGGLAWSTVMGIDATTQAKWVPARQDYTFDTTSALTAAGIFAPMTKLWYSLHFDQLPKKPEFSDKRTSPHVILCSLTGIGNYEFALQQNQDTFRGVGKMSGQDPAYDKPTFRNIPLDYIEALDSLAVYPTAAAGAMGTETDDTNDQSESNSDGVGEGFAGPRYYFVNGEYLKFVVHSENYAVMTDVITPSDQPFSRVQVMDMWNNCICRSRRRQGILYPGADTTDA
jgi:hypothetical protein